MGKNVPRVVLSKSPEVFIQSGFDFEGRDLFFEGNSDEISKKIIESAGWTECLERIIEEKNQLDK